MNGFALTRDYPASFNSPAISAKSSESSVARRTHRLTSDNDSNISAIVICTDIISRLFIILRTQRAKRSSICIGTRDTCMRTDICEIKSRMPFPELNKSKEASVLRWNIPPLARAGQRDDDVGCSNSKVSMLSWPTILFPLPGCGAF